MAAAPAASAEPAGRCVGGHRRGAPAEGCAAHAALVAHAAAAAALEMLGGLARRRFTLGAAGGCSRERGESEEEAAADDLALRAARRDCLLLDEHLPEVISAVLCREVPACLAACRAWREMLDHELFWERACLRQWPGARPLGCCTWRCFAAQGGGDRLGAQLLLALKRAVATRRACPRGHGLRGLSADKHGLYCGVCGRGALPIGAAMWICMRCEYVECPACYKRAEALPTRLAAGATNCVDAEGWSSLHFACRLGSVAIAEKLLDARARVEETTNEHGYTALMVGATHGHREVCALLLARGAEKATRNTHGVSALECARRWGRDDLEQLLAQ